MTNKPSRRDLLSMGAAGALGLAFLPMLRRIARAAPGPGARADRVLILNLSGGIRSSAAFHASARRSHNPAGLMTGVASTVPFALGRWLDDGSDDASYRPSGAWGNLQLPRLREMATEMSVLGTYSPARGDHLRARIEEPTGSATGAAPGILTRVGAGLAAHTTDGAPAFHLAPGAQFGGALGDLTRYVPVSLSSIHSIPSAATIKPEWRTATGDGFATDEAMRDRLDARVIGERHGVGKQVTETLSFHRRAARGIGARLAEDDFALAQGGKDSAALGTVLLGGPTPLTNGMLKSLFATGAPAQYRGFADSLALAVRLLQIGSPAVTLETPTFDFHSGEAQAAPPLYGYLGRAWAALWWLLSHIPSGSGTLLDRTLVVTMSDFGRDPGTEATGYNAGDGSDHGADHACFYLAHAVMGAGTRKNRLVGPVDTGTYNATLSSVRYSPQQLLVTILDALGLDARDEEWGLPTGGAPIGELWS